MSNVPTLDQETVKDMHKLEVERSNNEQFFNDRTYIDTGEPVGDDEFWSVKVISVEAPFDRAQGYTYFFAVKNLEDFPTEKLEDTEISEIHLDKAVPDDEGDARFKIVEQHDFMFLDELTNFAEENEVEE